VHNDNDTCRRDFSRVVIAQLVPYVYRFISDFQHGRANGHDVARAQLTFVFDVLFNGGHSSSVLAAAGPGEAQL